MFVAGSLLPRLQNITLNAPKTLTVCSDSLSRTLSTSASNQGWGNEHRSRQLRGNRSNRGLHPKWRGMKATKILRAPMPDKELERRIASGDLSKFTPSDFRSYAKKMGILSGNQEYKETPFYISSTGAIEDQYFPPESDGQAGLFSKEGMKDTALIAKAKSKTLLATRKVRKFEDEFDPSQFAQDAVKIYINANKALMAKDDQGIRLYATDKVIPEMFHHTKKKTIEWDYLESLAPPKVVQVRTSDVFERGNVYAQVTVRMHSKQILAVYDRFGRLIHGSPVVAKDVLEYIVFEKHLPNIYAQWRVHGKILPIANEGRPSSKLTYRLTAEDINEDKEEPEIVEDEKEKDYENDVFDQYGKPIKN